MPKNILSYAPTGLRKTQAALHCAVSVGYFDKMVSEGVFPVPRCIGDGVKVWIRQELDDALFAAPCEQPKGDNPFDAVLGV